jgi:hypothetical protein
LLVESGCAEAVGGAGIGLVGGCLREDHGTQQ